MKSKKKNSKKEVFKQKKFQKVSKMTSKEQSIKKIRESLNKAEKTINKIKIDLEKSRKIDKKTKTKSKTSRIKAIQKVKGIKPKQISLEKSKIKSIKKADIKRADIKKAGKIQPKNTSIKTLKKADIKRADIKKAGKISIKKANISIKKPDETSKQLASALQGLASNQGLAGTQGVASTKHRFETASRDFEPPKDVEFGKIEKVSTGIENLDKITLGGFNKNSINLIMGETGTAKSILATQFLIEGTKKGEPCLFISFEESKNEFYNNMMKLGWNLTDLEKQGKFFFLHYSPGKVRTMLEEGGGIIENLVIKNKIKRIAIDSITSFALLFENYVKKRESILLLFNLLRKWGSTNVLTYVGNPTEKFKATPNILEFESDSIIFLYLFREEKNRNRYLEVFKMRGTDHSKQIYQFEIKNGINLTDKVLIGNIN